jgi:hypothetical protein
MDRLHQPVEHRVEELPCFLGIAVGGQFHRALEVGEENGDLFAFAFERGLGGEDALGEVLGRVSSPRRTCRRLSLGRVHSRTRHRTSGLDALQEGQSEASRAPQSPQNFLPGGFSCWQAGQCIPGLPCRWSEASPCWPGESNAGR